MLVSEVTMEPRPWKWQGYIFSPAPLLPVYRLTWLSLVFPQTTQTQRNRADPCWKFSEGGRSARHIFGPQGWTKQLWSGNALCSCPGGLLSPMSQPPSPEGSTKEKKSRKGRENNGAHCMEGISPLQRSPTRAPP